MKKVLFVSTVDQHIRHFHLPFLKLFKDKNFTVHVASNNHEEYKYVDSKFEVCFSRNPFSFNNIIAFRTLLKIVKNGNYDIIHCHTPVAGLVTRFLTVFLPKNVNPRIIYTAHGFHFFKGASISKWLLFYPLEYCASFFTDDLITINKEDYSIAKKFKAKNIHLVQGVGVDFSRFTPANNIEKNILKKKYDFSELTLIYVAEISKRKNQKYLVSVIEYLNNLMKTDFDVVLVGKGDNFSEVKEFISSKNLNNKIKMLGYRTDVNDLMKASDICISTSLQEGLPINLIESMGVGNPIIASNVRGNRDLVIDNSSGILINLNSPKESAKEIYNFILDKEKIKKCSDSCLVKAKDYSIEKILRSMEEIYF